jgi:hypothetical protein
MRSVVTAGFRAQLGRLPETIRKQAARAYALWRSDPNHPGLKFKRVSTNQPIYSVRIGLGYRALGLWQDDQISWFWIGSHADFDGLIKQL